MQLHHRRGTVALRSLDPSTKLKVVSLSNHKLGIPPMAGLAGDYANHATGVMTGK